MGLKIVDEMPLRHRLVEQMAQPDLAPDRLELVIFVSRFDALRDSSKTEAPTQIDKDLAQAGIETIFIAVRDETAINV
jgi:hypothetical protein